jgi:hypothetical protein
MPNRTSLSPGSRPINPSLTLVRSALLLLLGVFLPSALLQAQQTQPAGADSDKQTIQMLLQRIEQLEARVTQLESARTPSAQPATMSLASSQLLRHPQPKGNLIRSRKPSILSPSAWT